MAHVGVRGRDVCAVRVCAEEPAYDPQRLFIKFIECHGHLYFRASSNYLSLYMSGARAAMAMGAMATIPVAIAHMHKHHNAEFSLAFAPSGKTVRCAHDGKAGLYNASLDHLLENTPFTWDELCDFTEGMLAGQEVASRQSCRVVAAFAEGGAAEKLVYFDVAEVLNAPILLAAMVPGGSAECATDRATREYVAGLTEPTYQKGETYKQRAVSLLWKDSRTLAIVYRGTKCGPTFTLMFRSTDKKRAVFEGVTAVSAHATAFTGAPFLVALPDNLVKSVPLYNFICYTTNRDEALFDAIQNVRTCDEVREVARQLAELAFKDVSRIARMRVVDRIVKHVY